MAGNSWEDKIRKQRQAYQNGISRNNEGCDEARDAPEYLKSRAEWARYCSGEITAQELERNLKGDAGSPELEEIKDVFSAEEVFYPPQTGE